MKWVPRKSVRRQCTRSSRDLLAEANDPQQPDGGEKLEKHGKGKKITQNQCSTDTVSLCDVRGGGVWGCVMDASCCERPSDHRRGWTVRGGGEVVGLDDSPCETPLTLLVARTRRI